GNRRHGGHGRSSSGAAFAVALALALSACSSSSSWFGTSQPASPSASPSGGSSFRERMNAFFFGTPTQQAAAAQVQQTPPSPDLDCPNVDVRSGAATLSVNAPGAEASATNLRYQASIGQTARECSVGGGTMTIKVGIQGRIILGPAGAPGQVEVPMRIALVREGIQPRTIWTRLYRVPVTVPPGQSNVPFLQIEEGITFPTPPRTELDAYIVYVGFDPSGLKAQPERRPPPKGRPKTGWANPFDVSGRRTRLAAPTDDPGGRARFLGRPRGGAEGATAPKTLRQKDRGGMTLWKAAARRSRGSPTE